MDFSHLDRLKNTLDTYRPLPKDIVNNLHEDLVLRWTFNSNAIEGNTLTLQETKVALEGITVGGKSLREHFETINHREAILYVEELVQLGELLNENDIKSIHSLILKNIDDKSAGTYRNINVIISGAQHKPPLSINVPSLMQEFVAWYKEEHTNMHPVELAARVHVDFVGIHPFVDGNGRTSRLLMNLELIKHGFPPAVIEFKDRLEYYKALDIAHTTKNYDPFLKLISKVVEESFEPYFYLLDIK
ncbi:Fic family protein [Clostridium sp.]|jgi:Fic family protein|uniref:Fic family protein n=1 Tax=Clostridium sp. TaxID=1506 RepID=UPI003EE98E15